MAFSMEILPLTQFGILTSHNQSLLPETAVDTSDGILLGILAKANC